MFCSVPCIDACCDSGVPRIWILCFQGLSFVRCFPSVVVVEAWHVTASVCKALHLWHPEVVACRDTKLSSVRYIKSEKGTKSSDFSSMDFVLFQRRWSGWIKWRITASLGCATRFNEEFNITQHCNEGFNMTIILTRRLVNRTRHSTAHLLGVTYKAN